MKYVYPVNSIAPIQRTQKRFVKFIMSVNKMINGTHSYFVPIVFISLWWFNALTGLETVNTH